MTPFEKRIERIAAALGPLPRKMTFVYADGHQVEVTGFLAAARQSSKGEGIVDVLGTSEGLKAFILAAQCNIRTLWDDEAVGGGMVDGCDKQQLPSEVSAAPTAAEAVRACPKRTAGAVKKHGVPVRKRRM